MNWAGVGNAAAGMALFKLIENLFKSTENKLATKKDIQELKTLIKGRYLPVNNARIDSMGRSAFYDVETGNVEYLYR